MILSKTDIEKLIPHRDPFLFVDECDVKIEGEHGLSYKKFNSEEYFFKGHFPGNPIVPGVIIVEAMAQTAGIVVSYKLREYKDKSVLFMSVNKAKFRKPILPIGFISIPIKVQSIEKVYLFLRYFLVFKSFSLGLAPHP